MEPSQEQTSDSPIISQKYNCLSDMVDELINLGPSEKTYSLLFDLVGKEKEDVIREKLSSFYQGSATASGLIYGLLIEAGKANPIDSEIVGGLMAAHPELFNSKKNDNHQHASLESTSKYAGLFIPDSYSGIKTNSEKLVKTADSAAFPHYPVGDNLRMCPKIRDVVSTDICRYHCLDGIVVANAEPVCGEELWRNNIMDKYSAEHLDKDGKWVGGYLEKRFKTFHDDGGHSMMIKPGNRSNPIHEDAWSPEKRLVELRKSEGKNRGYNGVYEPKDLYNFDQHEKGEPKNPQLFCKKPDPASRTASSNQNIIKTANTFSDFSNNGEYPTSPGNRDVTEPVSKICANPNCTQKNKNYGMNIAQCPACHGTQFQSISAGQAAANSGQMQGGNMDISAKIIIKNDLGVYSATKDGITAFASTREDAIIKLAEDLANLKDETVDSTNEALSDLSLDEQNPPLNPLENQTIEDELNGGAMPENIESEQTQQVEEPIAPQIHGQQNESDIFINGVPLSPNQPKNVIPEHNNISYVSDEGLGDISHVDADQLEQHLEHPDHQLSPDSKNFLDKMI